MAARYVAGDNVGPYVLVRQLGHGGVGTVWAANDPRGGQLAVKLLQHMTSDSRARFQREAAAMARLEHRHCIKLVDYGATDDGTPYLVMPLLDGTTLGSWADHPSLDEIRQAGAQLALALDHLHQNGMLHRDVKPWNVFVPDVRPIQIKLLDLGIAKLNGSSLTREGEVLGTLSFMSPEQARGIDQLSAATDAYGLGATLYWMLEGKPVASGDVVSIVKSQLIGPPKLSRKVPDDLATLVASLLDPEPARRPSVKDAAAILAAPQESKKGQAAAAATAATLLAVAAIGLLAVGESEPPPPQPVERRPTALGGLVQGMEADQRTREESTGSDPCGSVPSKRELVVRTPGYPDAMLFLPASYDASRTPLVIMLHSGADPPKKLAETTDVKAFADRYDVAVVLPHDRYSLEREVAGTWGSPEAAASIIEVLHATEDQLCVDQDNLFVVGFGSGGDGLRSLLCVLKITAAVTISGRPTNNWQGCNLPKPVPQLLLSPIDQPRSPVEGGPVTCTSSFDVALSLYDHERQSLNQLDCATEPTREERTHATCFRWDCDATLESCHVAGGAPFTETPTTCSGPTPEFDYMTAAFEFLKLHEQSR